MLKGIIAALALFGVQLTAQNLNLPGNVTMGHFVNGAPGTFTGCGDMNTVAGRYQVNVNTLSFTFAPTPPPGTWSATRLWGCSPNGQLGAGYTTDSTGRFNPFWVNSAGVAQVLATPSGGRGQLFGVTNSGEAAGQAGLPLGGNVNTGLAFLPVPVGTVAGGAAAIGAAPTGEIVRAGNRADSSGTVFTSLWINSTQYDLPIQSNFTTAFGLSETANRACGFDGGVVSLWNINVSARTFAQVIPRDSANATVPGIFRGCMANGLAWGRGDTLGAIVYDPAVNQVSNLVTFLNRYAIPHSFGLTNPADVWSIAYDPSTGKMAVATPGSLNIAIGPAPAAIFGSGSSDPPSGEQPGPGRASGWGAYSGGAFGFDAASPIVGGRGYFAFSNREFVFLECRLEKVSIFASRAVIEGRVKLWHFAQRRFLEASFRATATDAAKTADTSDRDRFEIVVWTTNPTSPIHTSGGNLNYGKITVHKQ